MPLILVGGIGLAFLITWAVLTGMQQGQRNWLQPLLESLSHPHGSFLTRGAMKVAAYALHGVNWIINKVMHALSVAVAHSEHAVAHWFDGLTAWVHHNLTTAGRFAEDVAFGFEQVIGHTVPREIKRATAPLFRGIDHLEHELTRLHARLQIWEHGIDRLLHHRIIPALRTAERAIAVTIPREFARERRRIGHLEHEVAGSRARLRRLAWAAAFTSASALVWHVLRGWKLQWLRCGKVGKVGRLLCGMNSGLFDALFLGAFEAFAVLDICDMVKIIEQAGEQFEPVLRGIVIAEDDLLGHCGYDLPTAADRQGYSGPWLSSVPD